MQAQGVVFFNGSSALAGSTVSAAFAWSGGRSAFTFAATTYGGQVIPQLQTYGGKWIPICSTIVSDQIFPFDAPAGQYRVVSTGSSVSLAATLTMTY